MQIRPLFDRVLVKRLESPTVTKSGLFIPEAATEKPQEAEVLAVGQGRLMKNGEIIPLQVKVGDRVTFRKYAGSEVKVNGEDRIVLREDDILGIFEA